MKTIKQYYLEELNVIRERRKSFTEWGYAPELIPLVDILCEAEGAIKKELEKMEG